ncbi:glycosyltransferase [Domibacillus sp. A3M-37]|uniref:glycosyltransferase family 2 protein n=1 Tax=Domibacillus sp. A3M-37 TaxID=2962037 RepID=UPI0020B8511D|nr:glycosyltransferase family 2 protein [Domibacillus sp. A3M-37]MCP3761379.1 glycosyltransferase [Domibacillus sp. A3M-37]
MPKVTVLMPVYNGELYLKEAIESILNQSFKDFEFLIINDGSTDSSEEIIKSYGDSRIRLVNNERNLRLIATLNKGLELARGEYIARMDCDDISHPKRLEKQVKKMNSDESIAICGTGFKVIGKHGLKPLILTDFKSIRNYLHIGNCIVHPSIMIRKSILRKNNYYYDPLYTHIEDYELFVRISKKYKIVNLNKNLLHYRLSPNGISRQFSDKQYERTFNLSEQALQNKGIMLNRKPYMKLQLQKIEILQAQQEIKNILTSSNYSEYDINEILRFLWLDVCTRGTSNGLSILRTFYSFKELKVRKLPKSYQIYFIIKCLIKRKKPY